MKIFRIPSLLMLMISCFLIQGNEVDTENRNLEGEEASKVVWKGRKNSSFGNFQTAFDTVTNPNVSTFLTALFTVVTIFGELGLLATHFTLWDPLDTKNSERFSPIRVYNSFTNPDIALTRIISVIGQASFQVMFLALPTLLWTGEPLDDNIPDDSDDRLFALPEQVRTRKDYVQAIRSLLSPNQIGINMTLILIAYLGSVSFFFIAPYFARDKEDSQRKFRDENWDSIINFVEKPPTFQAARENWF